jgi:hypothetical protein
MHGGRQIRQPDITDISTQENFPPKENFVKSDWPTQTFRRKKQGSLSPRPKKFKDFQKFFLPTVKDFSKTFESNQVSKHCDV